MSSYNLLKDRILSLVLAYSFIIRLNQSPIRATQMILVSALWLRWNQRWNKHEKCCSQLTWSWEGHGTPCSCSAGAVLPAPHCFEKKKHQKVPFCEQTATAPVKEHEPHPALRQLYISPWHYKSFKRAMATTASSYVGTHKERNALKLIKWNRVMAAQHFETLPKKLFTPWRKQGKRPLDVLQTSTF